MFIAVTQRILDCNYAEIRDSLDKRWFDFLLQCQLSPLLIPNNIRLAKTIINQVTLQGILLTGGGNISNLGGKDRDREEVEEHLIELSIRNNIPLLGICRGMQKIQDYFDIELEKIENHITLKQKILVNNKEEFVNSYHDFGTKKNNEKFEVWAKALDGIIKAIRHKKNNLNGIMWHPERIQPFRAQDIEYFKDIFK